MKLSQRISLITQKLTHRDISFFRKDLKSFKKWIAKMQATKSKASITDCIEEYNTQLDELILKTNELRPAELYRYIAIESLLNSKDCNSIIHRLNQSININNNLTFTGNIEHDYVSLVKTYYYKTYQLELR